MSPWKILVADRLHEAGLEILRAEAEVDERGGLTLEELIDILGRYDALIVRSRTQVTAEVLEASSQLKVVGRAGVGVDNIDLGAAQARGVAVVNAPEASTQAVAEHTVALMFAVARMIPRADAAMKSGQWTKKEIQGTELAGKTLGIIGLGRIGQEVARRAIGLGMSVIGHDPLLTEAQIRQAGARPVTRANLYAQSDYISLHVPLIAETRGMIDGQALAGMKRGVRLICTARGGVIDETALLAGLETGQVAAAGLDVFAKEPPGLTALVAHPNVVATPHIAAQTLEAQSRAAIDIATEVLAALQDRPLRWRIV